MDDRVLKALGEAYPSETRLADAGRLGIKPSTLGNYVNGHRLPGEAIAQRLSDDLAGRVSVAALRGWHWSRPTRCRFFDTDPMPPHRVTPDEPFRDRYSAEHAIRYLTEIEIADGTPLDVRIAAQRVIAHVRELVTEDQAG